VVRAAGPINLNWIVALSNTHHTPLTFAPSSLVAPARGAVKKITDSTRAGPRADRVRFATQVRLPPPPQSLRAGTLGMRNCGVLCAEALNRQHSAMCQPPAGSWMTPDLGFGLRDLLNRQSVWRHSANRCRSAAGAQLLMRGVVGLRARAGGAHPPTQTHTFAHIRTPSPQNCSYTKGASGGSTHPRPHIYFLTPATHPHPPTRLTTHDAHGHTGPRAGSALMPPQWVYNGADTLFATPFVALTSLPFGCGAGVMFTTCSHGTSSMLYAIN
jgi:hypothetical protein